MKKIVIIISVVCLLNICACGDKKIEIDKVNTDTTAREDDKVDAYNRTIIANALDIDEDSRNIRFILAGLNNLETGKLQSAECVMEGQEKVLKVVASDGTNYNIYLSANGSIDAVENADTGDWPIQSAR